MHVITVDTCPCCEGRELEWPMTRNAATITAFQLLSQLKYSGFMDGWENTLSLALARCRHCGHVWHHTHPDQKTLFEMYAHAKRLKGGVASTQPTSRMLSTLKGLHKYCTPIHAQSTFLDYGSGAGKWSKAAHEAGFSVIAYDPVASRQGQVNGIEVVNSLKGLHDRRFDIVNLEQVLEHVPNPADVLRELKRYCHDKTVLRISVPDISRKRQRIWEDFPFNGKSMHILSPYEHLHGFCKSSLEALLHTTHLQTCADRVLIMCMPHYTVKRWAVRLGWPFARTTVLTRWSPGEDLIDTMRSAQ